ncbi:MAG TPA: phosphoglycerate kinase [Hyphomicrobiaceae bacterium]|nr:phosphoglycerate kinase [Hyphomicrobiaceae bacterium]
MQVFRTVEDVDVAWHTVLMRVDLNVPIRGGKVTDATRIARVAPTIADMVSRRAKVVVLSHLGRPKGKVSAEYSLAPVAPALAEALGQDVTFLNDCIGPEVERRIVAGKPGEVFLLENLRFHAGEEKGDLEFAQSLAKLGEIFVSDAFSSSHRAHASITGLAELLPAYAGRLMGDEITALEAALECPKRPTAALVGGAKISSKIAVLENLVNKMDRIIIGGGMANTFLLAKGHEVGKSLIEADMVETAARIMEKAKDKGCEVLLPVDVVVAQSFAANAPHVVVPVDQVKADGMILDVGPKTVEMLVHSLDTLATLLWNGPLGAFELEPFGDGTFAVARAAADRVSAGKLIAVAGGGDTVAALNAAGVTDRFTYVSTAGGAFLEWLEGRELPGVAALLHNQEAARKDDQLEEIR